MTKTKTHYIERGLLDKLNALIARATVTDNQANDCHYDSKDILMDADHVAVVRVLTGTTNAYISVQMYKHRGKICCSEVIPEEGPLEGNYHLWDGDEEFILTIAARDLEEKEL